MKKLFVVVLSLLMVLSLAGCKKEQEEKEESILTEEKMELDIKDADGKLAEVLQKGVLVIATSPDYPPAEFVMEDGKTIAGCEMQLAQFIANTLDVKLQIETMDFLAALTAVDTQKVDMAVSGYGYKADREEAYEISIGYYATNEQPHHTILVPADKAAQYSSLTDFAGKKIDAQATSLQEMYVTDQIPEAELQLVSTLDQAILDLASGKVDGIALDADTAKNYAAQSEGKMVSLYEYSGIEFDLSIYKDYSGNILCVKKGEKTFINYVNTIIQYAMEQGLYKQWYIEACNQAGIEPDLN